MQHYKQFPLVHNDGEVKGVSFICSMFIWASVKVILLMVVA